MIIYAIVINTNNLNVDINECVTSNGGCEHQCKNTNGSYICQCKNGFFLDGNAKTCSGKFCFKYKKYLIILGDYFCSYLKENINPALIIPLRE